jgi:hypothetical protein
MDPEHEKYQSYIQMVERKETLVYNHGSEDRLNQLHEKLDHAVQHRKWKEVQERQSDVDFLPAHVKETRVRVDQAMNILKESNLCQGNRPTVESTLSDHR